MIGVTLTRWETQQALRVGKWRQEEADRQKLKMHCGGESRSPEALLRENQGGAGREMAFAKHVGVYWSYSVNTFKTEADVGDIEVRGSEFDTHNLVLRPKDEAAEKHDTPFVFLTGWFPEFKLWGWAWGGEVMQPENWTDLGNGRPALWLLEKRFLRPLETLPMVLGR
jgi:hypothetical protein